MTHTITVSDAHHEDALRAMLHALSDQLETASTELQGALGDPINRVEAADAYLHLFTVCRTVEALEALGWPADREELLQLRHKLLYGDATGETS